MTILQPISLVSDQSERWQSVTLELMISVASGVPTLSPVGNGTPVALGTSAAAPLDQTSLDAQLGTNEIVAATAFSATALGTDAMGFAWALQGQIKTAVSIRACMFLATPIWTGAVAATAALTSSLSTAVTTTALGNLYGRTVITGFDAGTGLLVVTLDCYVK